MKGVRVKPGTGTLNRNGGRMKSIVMLTIGLDAGEFSSAGWLDMPAKDARKLAAQLERAADRADLQLAKDLRALKPVKR